MSAPAPARVPVAILGPTGYTGLELIEWLLRHPVFELAYLASARTPPPRIDHEFPRLAGRLPERVLPCGPIDHDRIAEQARLAFLCLPHEAAMAHAPALLARGVQVVDLSAAYRLRDASIYERAYGHAHADPARLADAAYGLPEWNADRVCSATLVANPGCYPTGASLALIPLLRDGLIEPDAITIYAASGITGAGRDPKPHLHFPEADSNFSAYGHGTHRHEPEIVQTLRTFGAPDAAALFLPHLLPVERGILETITAPLRRSGTPSDELRESLRSAYAGTPFVVVRDQPPALRDTQRTNTVHIHVQAVRERLVGVVSFDNLVKGAAGQAIQNANLMRGLDEAAGLGEEALRIRA